MTENPEVKEISKNLKEIEMYLKAVMGPNEIYLKRGFIKCPECGEEILMVPTLKKMNEAIENHVKIHKDLPTANPLINRNTAMIIRLDLAQQVLQQASFPNLL